jgi:acetyl-CoA synthetase
MKHQEVREVGVISVPDELRGHIVKAFVVAARDGSASLAAEIQNLMRTRLSHHEYPRVVEFVAELPKTPAGKISRKALRDREKGDAAAV